MKYFLGIITLIAGILGVFFVSVKFERNTRDFEKKPDGYLKLTIPAEIGQTKSKDLPLGNTEEVVRASERLLSVTEWLNREYTLPDGKTFQLYISYWAPNKLDVRYASLHTPDRCWVENGWTNLHDKKKHDYFLSAKNGKLFPAYYREYDFKTEFSTYHRNVWFWFIVDGKRYEYGQDALISNPISYLGHAFSDALAGSPEQFFVRIDSEYPLENFINNKDFLELLDKLGTMVLYPKNKE